MNKGGIERQLTGRGDYIQPSNLSIMLRYTLPDLRSNEFIRPRLYVFTSFARVVSGASVAIITSNRNSAGCLTVVFRWETFFRNQPIDLVVVWNDWSSLSAGRHRALVVYEALQCVANLF